tara:strand:- start:215 stop:2878 length:2664 start_codon:yes stop_codon:yes gene_type:complete
MFCPYNKKIFLLNQKVLKIKLIFKIMNNYKMEMMNENNYTNEADQTLIGDINALNRFMAYPVDKSIVLVEEYNKEKLKLIIDNFDELFENETIGKFRDFTNGYKKINDKGANLTILKNLYKGKSVQYKPSPKTKDGRLFGAFSLQGINRPTRHTICKDNDGNQIYYDYDICSAHNSFLVIYCDWLGIDCRWLKQYNNNKDNLLIELMEHFKISRDDAKTIILSMLNGGGDFYIREEDTPDWLHILKLQLREISEKVCELNPELYKTVKKQKEFNPEGTVLNKILCKMENIVLQCMKKWCDEQNIKVGTLCFDGLLLKEKIEIENLENYIKHELGIEIKIAEKEMNESISDEIMRYYKEKLTKEKFEEFQEKERIKRLKEKEKEEKTLEKKRQKYDERKEKLGISFITSDMEIGKYIMQQVISTKDFYHDNETNEFYFYNKDTCLFETIKKEYLMKYIHPYAVQYCEEQGIIDGNSPPHIQAITTERLVALSNTKDQKNVLSQMLLYLPENHDFICRNFNKKRGIYPIKDNKVIDFKNNIIRDRTREDYFTMTSNYTCNLDISNEEIQECRNWIKEYIIKKERWNSLTDDDEKHIDNFLEKLGYVITAENDLKSLFIWYGAPNTGKSAVKNKCVDEVFQPFCKTLPNQFVCDRTNGLESVHQSHLFPLKYARVGICDELRKNEKPNETDLKKLTGGDREFTVRKACAPDGTKLHLNLVPIIPTNHDLLSIDPAFNNRKRIIEFVNVFKTNDKYIPYSGDLFSVVCKYAHKYYQNGQSIEWSNQILYSTEKVIGNNNMIKSFFDEHFELCETSKIRFKKDQMFTLYQKYCSDNKRSSDGRNSFYESFIKLSPNITCHRRLWWKGFKEIETPDSDDSDDDTNEITINDIL